MARYKTTQRDIILEYLKENRHMHITVDDVLFHLKSQGKSVGKATVYRYFDVLAEEGMLLKAEGVAGKSACYQLAGDSCRNHYHFICDHCNRLFHIECDLIDELKQHIRDVHAFNLSGINTAFHGLCHCCAAEA